MIKGQIISGEYGRIILRQKSDIQIELGELLVAKSENESIILQAYDLSYASQISQQNLELISGMRLEGESCEEFMDPNLRNYKIAFLKNLITINNNQVKLSKTLPKFFSEVHEIEADDIKFLTKPKNPLYFGKLRSGSRQIDVDIYLDGKDVFSHHVLVAATTGRGKSNLTSCMLWDSIDKEYCGILVLDPHDEYYGRDRLGLKNHPKAKNVSYYTPGNAPPGGKTLKINIENIKPHHFSGVIDWSTPQIEAMSAYYKKFRENWIEAIIFEKNLESVKFGEGTINVIKRRLLQTLDLEIFNDKIFEKGAFCIGETGKTTIKEITRELESSKKVIIDTSCFTGRAEILIGSLIANEVLDLYKYYKTQNILDSKPVISIILEEAPRVLGKEVLERSSNVFATIAKEGRKFKVGLFAITQLPSLIPREILANMNTKIILGIEMAPERQAIIESASHDLSSDSRNIASLDKGEAIVTSVFSKFAIPIKIPRYEEFAKMQKDDSKIGFSGIKLG